MNRSYGFTLVELIVALVVAIIVLTLGIPTFSTLIANNRAAADSNALVTALQLARSEAVKRGIRISVCAGNGTKDVPSPTKCTGVPGDWTNGFVVALNNSATSGAWVPTTANILRVWQRMDGNVSINDIAAGNLSQVDFLPDGAVETVACMELERALATGGQYNRWLGVYATGRMAVSQKKDEIQTCP